MRNSYAFIVGLLWCSLAAFSNAALPGDDLLLHLTFDGEIKDLSGAENTVETHGASLCSDRFGALNKACSFDGKKDYVKVLLDISPAKFPALTVMTWVKCRSGSAMGKIVSQDNGGFDRTLGIDSRMSKPAWVAFCGDHGIVVAEPITKDKWTFLAVVYDQRELRATIYVNETKKEHPARVGPGLNYLFIGGNPTFGDFFRGQLDDLRIYSRALSEKEIEEAKVAKPEAAGGSRTKP